MPISRDDVEAVLRPVDNQLIADIAATGCSRDELHQAWAWVNSDEALINEGRPLPGGRVADLIEFLSPPDDEA